MKNKLVVSVLSIVLAVSAFAGCGNSDKEDKSKVKESKVELTESDDGEASIDVPSSEEILIDDPEGFLKDEAEPLYLEMLQAEVAGKEIQNLICDDFDMDGNYEAFAFVGEMTPGDEYFPDSYSGDVYFINESGVKLVKEGTMEYADAGSVLDFGVKKYFIIEEMYATSYVTYIFSAENGDYIEDCYSGVGDLGSINGNDFTIAISAYDGIYDTENDNYMGHTWKQYYFHYSEEDGYIKEYEGEYITEDEASALLPKGVIEEMISKGEKIDNIILRENGILNVNFRNEEGTDIVFNNVNYDTVNDKYVEPWGDPVDNWTDSSFGGIYTRTVFTD